MLIKCLPHALNRNRKFSTEDTPQSEHSLKEEQDFKERVNPFHTLVEWA